MAIPVNLHTLAEEVDAIPDAFRLYLNKRTGETLFLTDEDMEVLDSLEEGVIQTDDKSDQLAEFLEMEKSGDVIELPTQFEIHKWSIMERFALSRRVESHRIRLDEAIRRRGAFRRFKITLYQLELLDEWYQFLYKAIEELLIPILDHHNIPYVQD